MTFQSLRRQCIRTESPHACNISTASGISISGGFGPSSLHNARWRSAMVRISFADAVVGRFVADIARNPGRRPQVGTASPRPPQRRRCQQGGRSGVGYGRRERDRPGRPAAAASSPPVSADPPLPPGVPSLRRTDSGGVGGRPERPGVWPVRWSTGSGTDPRLHSVCGETRACHPGLRDRPVDCRPVDWRDQAVHSGRDTRLLGGHAGHCAVGLSDDGA